MKKLVLLALFGLSANLLGGCGLLLTTVATDSSLSVEPAELSVALQSQKQVTVKVKRILPIDVAPFPLTVTLYNPPEGVSLAEDAVQIPSGIDERALTIAVAGSAAVGGPYTVTVEATSGLKTKQATFELTIIP